MPVLGRGVTPPREKRIQPTSGRTHPPEVSHRARTNGNPSRMTTEDLTRILASHVMKWDVTSDRFVLKGRRWIPRWRFRPTQRIEDAFRLLEALDPEQYTMSGRGGDDFCVRVHLRNGDVGDASNKSKACAITYAVARAIGVDFE
jgi:hypothetical protein